MIPVRYHGPAGKSALEAGHLRNFCLHAARLQPLCPLIPPFPVHQALEGTSGGVIGKISTEELHIAVAGVAQSHISGDMGGDDQVLGVPEGIIFRQGLRHHHVQGRAGDASGVQRLRQGHRGPGPR